VVGAALTVTNVAGTLEDVSEKDPADLKIMNRQSLLEWARAAPSRNRS
jgi:hypothetical protein